jgi:hypothetical protein
MGIVRAIEMLRQFAATQPHRNHSYRCGVTNLVDGPIAQIYLRVPTAQRDWRSTGDGTTAAANHLHSSDFENREDGKADSPAGCEAE